MEEVALAVEKRTETGRRACRHLRNSGMTPANLYGHGGENVAIKANTDLLVEWVRSDAQILSLDLEGQEEIVLIKEVQFDHLGDDVLHVDFTRVAMDEEITVTVSIDTKGRAPGVELDDGVLGQPLRDLEVICLPGNVPNSIIVDISELQLQDSVSVGDLELPEGVRSEVDPLLMVIQVNPPIEEEEEEGEEDLETPIEPELIRPEGREESEEEDT
tara:strand:- start:262 stop:909 length:648 start_codon:yes stop_codon:yes gene_type:complete